MIVGSTPVLAAEASADATPLPKVLTDLGITADDLQDVDSKAITEDSTKGEVDMMQRHYRRYCPRGYRLQAYRVRIGRFVIVRYRCVRVRHHRRWDIQQPATQQPAEQQTIEIQ
jgi:hypothetical protein